MPVRMKSGKSYLTVVERMNLLLKDRCKEDYSLLTDVTYDSGVVIVKATLILYNVYPKAGEDGKTVEIVDRKYTGHALGELGKAKSLEATETHAIGRALASAGWFGDEFASANEMEIWEKQQKNKPNKKVEKKNNIKPIPDDEHPLSGEIKKTMNGIEITDSSDVSNNVITFGKHKGKSWSDVDKSYIEWVANNSNVDWQREKAQSVLDSRGSISKPDNSNAEGFTKKELDEVEKNNEKAISEGEKIPF